MRHSLLCGPGLILVVWPIETDQAIKGLPERPALRVRRMSLGSLLQVPLGPLRERPWWVKLPQRVQGLPLCHLKDTRS
jgi:hypothetical protein